MYVVVYSSDKLVIFAVSSVHPSCAKPYISATSYQKHLGRCPQASAHWSDK